MRSYTERMITLCVEHCHHERQIKNSYYHYRGNRGQPIKTMYANTFMIKVEMVFIYGVTTPLLKYIHYFVRALIMAYLHRMTAEVFGLGHSLSASHRLSGTTVSNMFINKLTF